MASRRLTWLAPALGVGIVALSFGLIGRVVAGSLPCKYSNDTGVFGRVMRLIQPVAFACGGGGGVGVGTPNINSGPPPGSNWCFFPVNEAANTYPWHNNVYTTCFGDGGFANCDHGRSLNNMSSGINWIYGHDHCFAALPSGSVQKRTSPSYLSGIRTATITNPEPSNDPIFPANLIQVTNPQNGATIVVPILDTGPQCTTDDAYVLDPAATTIAFASQYPRNTDLIAIPGNPGCMTHKSTGAGLDLSYQAELMLGVPSDDPTLKWRFVKPGT